MTPSYLGVGDGLLDRGESALRLRPLTNRRRDLLLQRRVRPRRLAVQVVQHSRRFVGPNRHPRRLPK